MIQFSRSLTRQIRTVFRRCIRKPYGPPLPAVEFLTGPDGLHVRFPRPEFAVENHQPGSFPKESLWLPLEALDGFEGRGEDIVTLEPLADDKVLARWQDGGVPQEVEYTVPNRDKQPEFPAAPDRFARNSPELLNALDEAALTAPNESARYAVQRLQLKGSASEIVATDGRQLLIQGGISFPWNNDVLVTRLLVFGCKELAAVRAVDVGKTDTHVAVRVGPWTFALLIDTAARYPRVEQVIPKSTESTTRLRIDPEDAAFLAKVLPRLPGGEDDHSPLTVDLNGQVSLRARAEAGGKTTEVVLARSAYTGRPLRFCVNRKLLARLLNLGFAEIQIINPETPLLCQDGQRTFVTVPLPKTAALDPTEDALRLVSTTEVAAPKVSAASKSTTQTEVSTPQVLAASKPTAHKPTPVAFPWNAPTPEPEKRKMTVTATTNGNGNGHVTEPSNPTPESNGNVGLGALIAEAQALKEILCDSYGRSNRLVAALKRHRKQSKLVASTLASLRQLQRIEG